MPHAVAVAVPLAVIMVAYSLWWASDQLVWIGPLDRATFGWLVVVPVWLAAPIAGALAWQSLGPRASAAIALVVGVALAIPASGVLWQSVAHPACEFGAIRSPEAMLPPTIVVGVILGVGLATGCFAAATSWPDGHPWRAVAVGALSQFVAGSAAVALAALTILGPACQRPPL
jgi:hypothetical protein